MARPSNTDGRLSGPAGSRRCTGFAAGLASCVSCVALAGALLSACVSVAVVVLVVELRQENESLHQKLYHLEQEVSKHRRRDGLGLPAESDRDPTGPRDPRVFPTSGARGGRADSPIPELRTPPVPSGLGEEKEAGFHQVETSAKEAGSASGEKQLGSTPVSISDSDPPCSRAPGDRGPPCRIRRDGGSGVNHRKKHKRHRKCRRPCQESINRLQESVRLSRAVGVHFHASPARPSSGHPETTQDTAIIGWTLSAESHADVAHRFNHSTGRLTVGQEGLYLLYSQIECAFDAASLLNAHAVMVNDAVFVTCSYRLPDINVHPTCYTGGATLLREGDQVWIKRIHGNADVTPSSFWGGVRL